MIPRPLSVLVFLLTAASGEAAEPPAWPQAPPALAAPRDVEMGGAPGDDLRRGLDRLALPPYTPPWLLADVSFEAKRIFTNYSGDVSGRFLELAALTSPRDRFVPATFEAVLQQVLRHQKPDGHFGADFDLAKPFASGTSGKVAPLPMFWGNGRILAGLIAVAQERQRPEFLEAARKLGDYYVASGDQLCSAAREKEFKATGTYGDSFVCDYFPAVEGLALLYRATKDERYLKQAQRMAEFFKRFDALPVDHSHGNLCVWRGFLMLYDITGDRAYLDAAGAKWDAAVKGGFVWPIGGVGEHWHVNYGITEACSESDWLRLSLELWRFTGETRYLDMAERVLRNQYRVNQCPNGGFGSRHLESGAAGPWAVKPKLEEWNFCCSFHGPLGLHYLKSYLAAGSDRGVFVNFPLDFSAPVKAGGREGRVAVKADADTKTGRWRIEVELAPTDRPAPWRTALHLRVPAWAEVEGTSAGVEAPKPAVDAGTLRLEREYRAGEKVVVTLRPVVSVEARRFQPVRPEPGDVAVLAGPHVLFAAPATGRMTLLATADAEGRLAFPATLDGGFATVVLPGPSSDQEKAAAALQSAPPVLLRPWGTFAAKQRAAFMFDLVVVPDLKPLPGFADRAVKAAAGAVAQAFGEDLEKRRELWPDLAGWAFRPDGIFVAGGDVGLMDGEGWGDYRFEFEMVLPPEVQGIAGWVVRAQGADDCVMFQLQTADSPYAAPEYKTKPNTLRPHLRRGGQWTILDPVPLPKEVKRGEAHRVAVECRGEQVDVFLDGVKIHTMRVPELRGGAVGFRAGSPAEQGVYRKIALRKL